MSNIRIIGIKEIENIDEIKSVLFDILKDGLLKEVNGVENVNGDEIDEIKIENILLEILDWNEQTIYIESSSFSEKEWNGLSKASISTWCFNYKEKIKCLINELYRIDKNRIKIRIEFQSCLKYIDMNFGRVVVKIMEIKEIKDEIF